MDSNLLSAQKRLFLDANGCVYFAFSSLMSLLLYDYASPDYKKCARPIKSNAKMPICPE